jgi:hypothetical protein
LADLDAIMSLEARARHGQRSGMTTASWMMIRIFVGALVAVAINGPVDAQQQRYRATGQVIFYAAPNGRDIDNDCLSAVNPCTAQGAHDVAKANWDFAHGSCLIQLADGTYTSYVSMAGQYVGTHLCDLLGKVDSQGNCIDRSAVVFDVPPGHIAFALEDGMVASIGCLTVTGGGVGFFGRQFVIFDIVDIDCGHGISGVLYSVVNTVGEIWISGDQDTFAAASLGSQFLINGTVVAKAAATVTNLFVSYNKSHIELLGKPIVNPHFLAGSVCSVGRMGTISKNGTELPCREGRSGTPQQGNDGRIYD